MNRTLVCLAIGLVSLSCDGKESPASGATNAAPAPPPTSVHAGADDAMQMTGTLVSGTGIDLQYKQAFDAGTITDVVACGTHLLTLTDGGRIVEWDPKTRKVKQAFHDFGAVTSIDSNEGVLLAGTADGRLLRTTCDGRDPVAAPRPSLAVQWVHLDVRSQKRAFVVYKEPATPENKLPGTMASVALVDLETGHAAQEPFRRAWPENGDVFGFVDYRGELWFGMTPAKAKSTVWYLERFDETQPHLAGLGEEVMRGFLQVSREVWGYGGAVDGSAGFIYRVDSNRTKMLWDGEKAWFGERPGGELPTGPIVGIHKRGKGFVVVSRSAVFVVDKELRRWRRLEAHDSVDHVLASATPPVELRETLFSGTHRGLVAIDDDSWSRFTVPASPDRTEPAALAEQVTWRGADWTIGKRDRLEVTAAGKKQRAPKLRPKRTVYGFFVDALDRLFIAASDGLWMMTGLEKGEQHLWATTDLGLAGNVITGVGQGGKPDALEVSTSYGGHFRLRIEAAPRPQPEGNP